MPPAAPTNSHISGRQRQALLERHGRFALAYSVAHQPDLRHFGDADGFLSYCMVGSTAFVLADPLAPPARHGSLIDAFVAEKGDVTFWQVSRETAAVLAGRGFAINALGIESVVDLGLFNFSGPRRRSFRTAANRFRRTGHRVVERPLGEFDPAALRGISEGWRRTRTTRRHEMRFLVRPAVLSDEPGVRKFFIVDAQDQPVAFAFFDPVHEDGRLAGYLSATRRWLPDADPLSAYFLVHEAVERFREERVERLYLGLMPFHRIEDDEFERDWLTRRVFRLVYTNRLANWLIYPSQTLARHKESYDGTTRQTYCAQNTRPSLPRLLKLLRACRVA